MQIDSKDGKNSFYRSGVNALSGISGGIVATALWHPLDLLRTRLSAQGFWEAGHVGERYTGLIDAISKILRQEGFKGIYRGVSAAMVGSGISWGVYLSTYHALRPQLGGSALGNFSAGVLAGIVQTITTNPFWLIKTRMQLQQDTVEYKTNAPLRYRSMVDGLRTVWRTEGIAGLYRGITPGLVMTPHGGFQFAVIEECKRIVRQRRGLEPGQLQPAADIFFASALGKVIATSITHPILVVRVRLQDEHNAQSFLSRNVTTYNGLLGSMRTIWVHEGIRGFYKGLLPNLLKAVPISATAITVADYISSVLL